MSIFQSISFKKLLLLISFALIYYVDAIPVTFKVDMRGRNISSSSVHVAGNFQSVAGLGNDWDPASTKLNDAEGDSIYSITIDIPPGNYEYKFINGSSWGLEENPQGDCITASNRNRTVTIGEVELVLPAVPFNGCIGRVTLSINMSNETISSEGIHVMGNFQKAIGLAENWDPATLKLEDLNKDNTFETTFNIPYGEYEYVFVNGKNATDAEVLQLDCSIEGENNTNSRIMNVTEGGDDPKVYCFGTCEVCDPNNVSNFSTYWWNDAVFYEMFIRSFYDSDGDGIGDFKGAIEKLDYLNDGNPETETDLGITAIWLMPMMESPSYHGYDVTNYYKTEPDYGSMEDFEAFLDAAHERGIKVIIDLVLNHSSSEHEWFIQSNNNDAKYRDWYIWSETDPDKTGPWGQKLWHQKTDDFYYGIFWSEMPDLNYTNQEVKEEMYKVADFWLDKGVDGYRLDAIKYLIEDGDVVENTEETFTLLEDFSTVFKTKNPQSFSIGEAWTNTSKIIPYVQNNRMDACFDFDLAGSILDAVNNQDPVKIEQQMKTIQKSYPILQYGTFLTNHDMDRVYNQIGSNEDKMKLAASLYLTLPGVPFIYYGEEIKMVGTGAHENIRRPMQWSNESNAGFSTVAPWYGIGSGYLTNNVKAMEADPASLLNHYKKLVHIRTKLKALQRGNYINLNYDDEKGYHFIRIHSDEAVIVSANTGTNSSSPVLSLASSTLPTGNYFVTDVYNNQAMGSIEINNNGGFENWQPFSNSISSRTARILSITKDNPLSVINNTAPQYDFTIAPNPTEQVFSIYLETIQPSQKQIEIISPQGKLLYSKKTAQNSLQINTREWSSGIYFVKVSYKNKSQTKRLVIR